LKEEFPEDSLVRIDYRDGEFTFENVGAEEVVH
jgi:hypothetical protein